MSAARASSISNPDESSFASRRFAWLVPLIGVLVFANSALNQFAYDDVAHIKANPRITSLKNTWAIFSSDWWAPQNVEDEIDHRQRDRLYRPVSMISLALNYAVGGLNPIGYHVANILMHALACWLVFVFTQRLFHDDVVAFVAGLIFAVHPIHAEAVANVVGRAEVLACLFLLVGLIVLVPRGRDVGVGRAVLAGLCFLVALLAKETAICFVPVAAIVLYYRECNRELANQPTAQTGDKGRSWWQLSAIVAWPLFIYFPARYVALEGHIIRDQPPAEILNAIIGAEGIERVWMALEVLGHYTRLMLAPQRLSSNYGYAILDPEAPHWPLVAVGAATLLAGIWLLAGLRSKDLLRQQLAICAAMFVASYALISNSILLIGVAVGERLMYWPSVPLCLLFASALIGIWRRHAIPGGALFQSARLLKICGIALLIVFALRTVIRNPDWFDTPTLYLADAAQFPDGVDLLVGAAQSALALLPEAPPEEQVVAITTAEERCRRAIAIMPEHVEAHAVLSQLLALQGRTEEALASARAAVAIDASDRTARRMLRMLQSEAVDEELQTLRQQHADNPDDLAAQVALGRALLLASLPWEGEPLLADAAARKPESAEIQRLYADALMLMNKRPAARERYERVLRIDPDDWQTHLNLARLIVEDDADAALVHAKAAFRLRPDMFEAHQNLAEAYVRVKEYDRAIEMFEQMQAGLPKDDPLQSVIADRLAHVKKLRGDS